MYDEIKEAGWITIAGDPGTGTNLGGKAVWRGDQIQFSEDLAKDMIYLIANGQAVVGKTTFDAPAPATTKNKSVDPAGLQQK